MTIFESFTYLILNNMRKFYLLLVVALLATSSAFADITYELNGGQPNPYGWNSKEDLFNDFMADAGVTTAKGYNDYKGMTNPYTSAGEAGSQSLGSLLTTSNIVIPYAMPKWTWLLNYIKTVTGLGDVSDYTAKWRFYTAQFLLAKGDSPAYAFDFTEAGKDEAYLPAWEYCYAFPTTVTATTTLKTPWKKNCTFGGWYTTSDFSGTAVTKIEAGFTGTLYAKWINNVLYELNGGKWNPYDWTSKEDLFNAFMKDAGVTNALSYASYKDEKNMTNPYTSAGEAGSQSLGSLLTTSNIVIPYAMPKWTWLLNYIQTVTGLGDVSDNTAKWRFYTAQFLLARGDSPTYKFDFTEAGKDEAYCPKWGYSYGNPSIVEGEYTLKNPYREGAWEFAGWYKNAECTGEPITTINADFAGTLYAKWKYVREGITYDLNGGSFINNNPYGWKSKDDMLQAFLTDGSANECTLTIADFQNMKGTTESKDGLNNNGLCKYLTSAVANAAYANTEKWGWLVNYVKKVFADAGVTYNEGFPHYPVGAFFISGQSTSLSWLPCADFKEAGKDENYFPAWGYSYELSNPKFPEADFELYAAEKEGCTFQGWYDNRWFTGEAVTTVGATTNGTLYAHWSSIMGDGDKTLNTLHTHYFDGTYIYASTIGNTGSNKNLYNIDKAGEYFSDNNPKGDRKDITLVQEDWVAIAGLTSEDVNKEIAVGTAFTKVANTDFPVISFTAAAPQAASAIEVNNYRVANFNIGADNAHVNNIWLVAPQAGEYCHITGYVKAVSGNEVTLVSSNEEADALEMTVNIANLTTKSVIATGTWYKFTGIVANGDKALKFNATAFEDVTTGVEASEIGNTIVRGMNGEIAVSVAAPATVSVYTAGGALVATRNIADSDAIAVAPGFYIVKADNTVVKVLVK